MLFDISCRPHHNLTIFFLKDALQNDITSQALLDHAEDLQAIAYQTTGRNRVFGSPGHNFTALYLYQLVSKLEDYYDVEYQPFIETYSGGSASLFVNGQSQNASLMTYAPNGQVEAAFVAVSNLGCNAVRLQRLMERSKHAFLATRLTT